MAIGGPLEDVAQAGSRTAVHLLGVMKGDATAIAAIYNDGIADRIVTFETEPRTAEQIAARLADRASAIRGSSSSVTGR